MERLDELCARQVEVSGRGAHIVQVVAGLSSAVPHPPPYSSSTRNVRIWRASLLFRNGPPNSRGRGGVSPAT
eukprot:7341728-Pyramimonas_sp.AAC.1